MRIFGSSLFRANSISDFGTRIWAGATPSNSFANAIKSDSFPFLTRARIGSTSFKALSTSKVARGSNWA